MQSELQVHSKCLRSLEEGVVRLKEKLFRSLGPITSPTVWFWYSKHFNNPYVISDHETLFSFILICKQVWGLERAALSLATPLDLALLEQRGKNTHKGWSGTSGAIHRLTENFLYMIVNWFSATDKRNIHN